MLLARHKVLLHGKKCHYYSSIRDNNYYNFNKAITSKGISSFNDIGCQGKKLRSAMAADKGDLWPIKWSRNTSKEAKKIKSFRIQGYKDIPITGGNLDIASCK
ncbi:hypothetical protein HZ326_28241 [Fusarium oxysporum f. sp. albedinis]|nr:hypothetical protein HZ326_28241 [Fusarium oxysporum f. sp. albedinis]